MLKGFVFIAAFSANILKVTNASQILGCYSCKKRMTPFLWPFIVSLLKHIKRSYF